MTISFRPSSPSCKVKAVCKKAGCWMEIGDDANRAHVKMAGHGFFVPKDCDGRTAVARLHVRVDGQGGSGGS